MQCLLNFCLAPLEILNGFVIYHVYRKRKSTQYRTLADGNRFKESLMSIYIVSHG